MSEFDSHATTIKIKLLELLLNNIYKYNNNDCREKYVETVIDEITYLL